MLETADCLGIVIQDTLNTLQIKNCRLQANLDDLEEALQSALVELESAHNQQDEQGKVI